ncbi:hypothetical protein QYF61_007176 [Mycteria americana]|uniref:Maestro/Maestro-like HEAT-repeats domain-containing protein n=1 Tax=Mycteria americana TaxID=33587 RepID=A0AAN7NHN5_MYCAM|nr:hypothetical protein QYF61_007173 [Mycteria americana]KAK4815756.1 hypothetical protein QYF61_007174 [Mycteria americana]KAK4815758.1 hypothetical protein QYF61_007176 [Mycteria americana]
MASQNEIVCFAQAVTLQGLLPAVLQRLQDDDGDVAAAALAVLGNVLCLEDRPRAVSIALQLVETLPPLFENESSCVQARSILLWRDAMEVAVSTHKEQMRKDMQRSLLPLFFHLHDKDDSVAQVRPSECASTGAQPPESLRRAQSPSLPAATELAAAEKGGRDISCTCPA